MKLAKYLWSSWSMVIERVEMLHSPQTIRPTASPLIASIGRYSAFGGHWSPCLLLDESLMLRNRFRATGIWGGGGDRIEQTVVALAQPVRVLTVIHRRSVRASSLLWLGSSLITQWHILWKGKWCDKAWQQYDKWIRGQYGEAAIIQDKKEYRALNK